MNSNIPKFIQCKTLTGCLNSSNEMYALGGGSCCIRSCNNALSSRFSIALFDWLFVALALALERGRFDVGRAPTSYSYSHQKLLSTIYDLSKRIFDQQ